MPAVEVAPPPPPPPPPARRVPVVFVIVAIGLIGVLGAVAIVVIRTWDRAAPAAAPPPAAAPSPKKQAGDIDAILERSSASRAKLNGALQRVQRCTGLAAALADMRQVGVERKDQIADTAAVTVSALPDGERVRSTLTSALTFALEADRHFVAWAEPAVTDGCRETKARRADWDSGQKSSEQAQAAKKQLVAVWNPVAGQYGFKQRSTQQI
jgi:hypothetical protein